MTDLAKWKKCVVHLEGATDSTGIDERMSRLRMLADSIRAGEVPSAEALKTIDGGYRDVRYHGTAIFMENEGRRYLVTARHVLWNEKIARKAMGSLLAGMTDTSGRNARLENWIFPIIYRVPSLDEFLKGTLVPSLPSLMNLGAGVSWLTPYTYSSPENDIAVISLDQTSGDFADNLAACGYEPIRSDEVGSRPSGEGVDIVAVGYPSSVSILGGAPLPAAFANWASSVVSLPTFSWGRVAMCHERLPFYWADISVYPGNSGGPIVEGDNLVGIISSQAVLEEGREDEDVSSPRITRIPFARVMCAELINEVLQQQIKKDIGAAG